MNIEVMPVTPGGKDWETVKQIRFKVFVEEQHVDEREEYDEFEDVSHHYLALVNGNPAGTARWRATEKGFKLERFAVLLAYRGSGVGSRLVEKVLDSVKKVNTYESMVYLHAQVQALPFYEKHGFEPFGDQFIEAEIVHQAMKAVLI